MTVSLKLAAQTGIIREEPTYSFTSLVSDIGGALGLVLGLSILDLLIPVSDLFRKSCHMLVNQCISFKTERFQTLVEVSSPASDKSNPKCMSRKGKFHRQQKCLRFLSRIQVNQGQQQQKLLTLCNKNIFISFELNK